MINIKEKLFTWVDEKIGDKVEAKIEESIQTKGKFDVESYAKELVNDVFNDQELKKLREKILAERDFESDFSVADTEEDFLDTDVLDLSAVSLESDTTTNEAEKSCRLLLQSFEYLSVDEIIGQTSWSSTRKMLQSLLIPSDENSRLALFSLKILKRLLASSHSSKAVSEGFTTLAESIASQIESINKRANIIESEELYDIRENKVYRRSSQRRRVEPAAEGVPIDVLIRSMHLLLSAHKNMPGEWLRFNERRLHEIIFAFVNMLALSFSVEKRNISAFDVVTALQPRGNWCRYWVHSATGRTLLCQAFRKHHRLFHSIVETVITNIVAVQEKRPRKHSAQEKVQSAPPVSKSSTAEKSNVVSVIGVPEEALKNGRFCHCFAILTYLVQFRAGRALFPLQTSRRRRPWSVQDVVALMVDFIEIAHSKLTHLYSPFYMHHLMDMARILLIVEEEISTARGTQPQRRQR